MAGSVTIPYICLQCGSENGEPRTEKVERWYWQMFPHGQAGPFCSYTCLRIAFPLEDEVRFTLTEWERLAFWRHQHSHGLTA